MSRKYYGIGLNFGKDRKGFFSPVADKKLIRDSIYSILMTHPGERVHLPDFGVGLDLYVFEQNDEVLEDILRTKIIDQINKWEPGVDIVDLIFTRDNEKFIIQLVVRLRDFNGQIEKLDYSVSS
jgi:phage baseplate assembly protein W